MFAHPRNLGGRGIHFLWRLRQHTVNLGLIHKDGEWLPYWDSWIEWMRNTGWRRFGFYVWDKLSAVPGDWQGRLAPAHEFIFHFNKCKKLVAKTKEKKAASVQINNHGSGLRRKDGSMSGVSNQFASLATHKIPDSVFRVIPHKARGGANAIHPAMFPVALALEVITAFGKCDDAIYEPFSGSFTTGIACEMEKRRCYAVEIDPAYVQLSVERWEKYSGKKAKREDGATLEDLKDGKTAKKVLRAIKTGKTKLVKAKP